MVNTPSVFYQHRKNAAAILLSLTTHMLVRITILLADGSVDYVFEAEVMGYS
jgi:hypothetical protein